MQLLPALVTLDAAALPEFLQSLQRVQAPSVASCRMAAKVSGCLLNGPVQHLLQPLLASTRLPQLITPSAVRTRAWQLSADSVRSLARISADRANLSGELLDRRSLPDVAVDRATYSSFTFKKAVQVLQLSNNQISRVSGFPALMYVSIANNSATQIDTAVLRRVLKDNLQLDVTGTRVSNANDIQNLFDQGDLKRTAGTKYTDTERGFACYDVTATGLRVTPPLFFHGLCACHEGFDGNGTLCQKCARGSYNQDFNSSCVRCPANSTTVEVGAGSVDSCSCETGRTAACGSRVCNGKTKPGLQGIAMSQGRKICGTADRASVREGGRLYTPLKCQTFYKSFVIHGRDRPTVHTQDLRRTGQE